MSDLPNLVEPGAVRVLDVGDDKALLFYDDGTVRFRHLCDRTALDRGVVICAPALQTGPHGDGHRVVDDGGSAVTVEPSIACPDCGTHGYVRSGIWQSV